MLSFPRANGRSLIVVCLVVIASMTLLRGIFAALWDLRVDEAYYWTWSKESVLSYLDHPPMIAWSVRLGTAIFGDTNFGVRLSGLLAMVGMQIMLADIVWQTVRDARYAAIAALLPDTTLDYGLLMSKVAPDTALIAFAMATAWALVRLAKSGDLRWWLAVGVFGGCCLLSKYTAVLLLPAILGYVLIPSWRNRHLASPYFWLAPVIALAIFSPVLIWNAQHDWASFKFQLARPAHINSTRFFWDFIGLQFALIGPIVMPVVTIGTMILFWRGLRLRAPIAILLAGCVLLPIGFFVVLSSSIRIGDSWTLFLWPLSFACAAINLYQWPRERPTSLFARTAPYFLAAAIVTGLATVIGATAYYLGSDRNFAGDNDPLGKEAGFANLVRDAERDRVKANATWFATTDYRIYSLLRWHLRDRIPVLQINERNRFIGFQRDPRIAADAPALYIFAGNKPPIWADTTARFAPVGRIDLTWRKVVYDRYTTERLTQFTPTLAPPVGSPFYNGVPL